MIYINIPLKNIRKLFCKNTFMTMMLVISQIISIVVLFLAYGMIENSKRDIKEFVETENYLSVYTDSEYTVNDVRNLLDEIFEHYGNKIDRICVSGMDYDNDIIVYMRFTYLNGKIVFDDEQVNHLVGSQSDYAGRYFLPEEFEEGKKVVVTSEYLPECGEVCVVQGEEYEVVSHFTEGGFKSCRIVDMPYYAAPENLKFSSVSIALEKLPTISEYNYFAEKMFNFFDYDCEVNLPEKFSNQSEDMYKTYIIIGVIMLGISIIIIGTIYSYLLKVRRKDNAIMSLCGGKTRVILILNLIEIIIVSMASYFIATIIHNVFLVSGLNKIFSYFKDIFQMELYILFGVIYMISISVTSIYYINKELRKSIVYVLKGGGKR